MGHKFVNLSHTIEDGLITYKGLPAPIICDFMSREEWARTHYMEEPFHIGKIEMVANTGTYIDVPFHRYEEGHDLSETNLDAHAYLEGVVIRAPYHQTKAVNLSYFRDLELAGKAVLIHTGWDEFWNTDQYFEDNPFVTAEAAKFLVEQKVKLVGIDSLNIDDTGKPNRPVHTALLKQNILIVEHMCCLELVPDQEFQFHAVPPKVKKMGSFPVRAFARINQK